jgi:glycosyltransferase involved in cell wall biosynthesis
MAIRVLQIVAEPAGGIRKHVFSIMSNYDTPEFEMAFCFSDKSPDAAFSSEFESITPRLLGYLSFTIHKKPHWTDITNLVALIRYVRANNIDVVHGHGAKAGLYARLLRLFTKVKAIYTPHGGVLHSTFGPAMNKVFFTVEKIIYGLTDGFVFESNYSKSKFETLVKSLARKKTIMNYNGVNGLSIDNKVKDSSNFKIGFFGRLTTEKGADLTLDVFLHLLSVQKNRKGRTYSLHLYGSGELLEKLTDRVEENDLQECVHFHHDCAHVEQEMSSMNCILITSQLESFSYVAAEALMLRIPVVANSVGGLKEVLDNGAGHLVEHCDIRIMAKTIENLSIDEKAYLTTVERGYMRYKENFTESRMVERLEEFYKTVLNA